MTAFDNLIGAIVASGPIAVFLIFLSPVGPGAVAGILLARSQGMAPGLTIALYTLSDVVAAVILEPLIARLPRFASRSAIGKKVLATFNRLDQMTDLIGGRLGRPIGLATFTFATDFFTAAVVSSGMQMSRVIAWSCIIAGDVIWFVIILAASMSIASVLSDNRIIFIFTLVVGFGLPVLIRRIVKRRQGPKQDSLEYRGNLQSPPTIVTVPNHPRPRPD